MTSPDHCLRCDGRLEEGFVMDQGHYDVTKVSAWVKGEPVTSFWTGVKAPKESRRPIRAMRCTGCGRIELFAT